MPDESTTDPGAPESAPDPTTQPPADLGDAGKKALEEERTARREAERARKTLEKELVDLRAQSMSDAEKAVAAAKAEGRTEALASANTRLVKAEVRVAAAGKLADPADAVKFLDLDEFKVGDDGEVDTKAVAKAIDQLVKDKPYLAAGVPSRPSGSGDGGPRGNPNPSADMNQLLRRAAGRA